MPTTEDGNQSTKIVGKSKKNFYLYSMNTTAPVYPKEDPEYRKKIMSNFLQLVKNTRWEEECSAPKKSRGRKPKPSARIEAIPRSEGEARVVGKRYNWFN